MFEWFYQKNENFILIHIDIPSYIYLKFDLSKVMSYIFIIHKNDNNNNNNRSSLKYF